MRAEDASDRLHRAAQQASARHRLAVPAVRLEAPYWAFTEQRARIRDALGGTEAETTMCSRWMWIPGPTPRGRARLLRETRRLTMLVMKHGEVYRYMYVTEEHLRLIDDASRKRWLKLPKNATEKEIFCGMPYTDPDPETCICVGEWFDLLLSKHGNSAQRRDYETNEWLPGPDPNPTPRSVEFAELAGYADKRRFKRLVCLPAFSWT